MTTAPTRIEGRTPGGWIIAGRLHLPALLVTAATAQSLGRLTLEALDAAALPSLDNVDLLLLGTGSVMLRPPSAFVSAARVLGLRIETMDSPAAARTFNILIAEERRVAALLLQNTD